MNVRTIALMVLTLNSVAMAAKGQQNTMHEIVAFAIETDVLVGKDSKPVHRTVTLFKGGVAYDLPRDNSFISVVDPHSNRIVLLDSGRQVQTIVSLSDLKRFTEDAKINPPDWLQKIISDASKESASEDKITVGGTVLRYEATLQPAPTAAEAQAYAAFADALAHLNANREPSAVPYARLHLNKAISTKTALPREISKSMANSGPLQRSIVHATWRLTAENEKQIAAVENMMTAFPQVSSSEFFASPLQTALLSTPGK